MHRKDYTQILVNAQSDNFVPIDGNADQKYDPELVEKKLTYNVLLYIYYYHKVKAICDEKQIKRTDHIPLKNRFKLFKDRIISYPKK